MFIFFFPKTIRCSFDQCMRCILLLLCQSLCPKVKLVCLFLSLLVFLKDETLHNKGLLSKSTFFLQRINKSKSLRKFWYCFCRPLTISLLPTSLGQKNSKLLGDLTLGSSLRTELRPRCIFKFFIYLLILEFCTWNFELEIYEFIVA
jgi:hypothetical protein